MAALNNLSQECTYANEYCGARMINVVMKLSFFKEGVATLSKIVIDCTVRYSRKVEISVTMFAVDTPFDTALF